MKIADARTARELDRAAIERYGITGLQLMENAGRAVAEAVSRELGGGAGAGRTIAVLAGKGNNGGDGYVAARFLRNRGFHPVVYSLGPLDGLQGDASANASAWRRMGGQVVELLTDKDLESASSAIRHSAAAVDAIFGTGLSCEVAGLNASVIALVNCLGKPVIAVDIPSGVDATTGAVLGSAVMATVTVTMAMPKLGCALYPGRQHAGRVEVADIGVPMEAIEDPAIRWELLTAGQMARLVKPRKPDSHKSAHGHLLVLAGSPGMTGAACMASVAAMRAGAGLVTAGVPESLHSVMEAKTVEVMTRALPESSQRCLGMLSLDAIRALLPGKAAVLVGPGMGSSEDAGRLVEALAAEAACPLVIDADALSSIASRPEALKKAASGVVLTPHPGEAARLLAATAAGVQSDRVGAATHLAALTGAVVVLKGASTVIAEPSGSIRINLTGNPALATAGTGDILAGMVGGLLAQGYRPAEAACLAVYAQGLAADELRAEEGEAGMMAMDFAGRIPGILDSLARAGS